MNSLVTANLKHHPGRTLASIAGVAIGVILVMLTVGLVRGMLRERGRRDTNTGVELMVSRRGQAGLSITSLPLSFPVELMDQVRQVQGVAAVAAVGQHLEMKGENGLSIRQVDGVEFDDYTRATKVRIVRGHPLPAEGRVAIVDVKYASAHHTKLGDKIDLLDRDFTIIGIYEPETGARIMIPLATMQQELSAEGKCSMLLVKCQDPDQQEEVAHSMVCQFPDIRILFTQDLPTLFATGYSGFNVFLKVVAALAAVISLLVITLTMYTTVSERTRQIGILKSLGASKPFIAGVFIKESLMISAIGVATGILLSLGVRAALAHGIGMKLDFEPDYLLLCVLGGLASGLVGSLYPAMRAASQDPIDALSYE